MHGIQHGEAVGEVGRNGTYPRVEGQDYDAREHDAEYAAYRAYDAGLGVEEVGDIEFPCAQRAQHAYLGGAFEHGDIGDYADHDAGHDEGYGGEGDEHIGHDADHAVHDIREHPRHIGVLHLFGGGMGGVPGVEIFEHGVLRLEVFGVDMYLGGQIGRAKLLQGVGVGAVEQGVEHGGVHAELV